MRMHSKQYIAEQAKIFKALGHPSRLLMVEALQRGEQCVSDLQALVGDDVSTISKHLAVLREAGIVTSQKRGTSIYYTLSLPCLAHFLHCTGELIEQRIQAQRNLL